MNEIIHTLEYKDFVNSIIQKIQKAQYESLKLVNKNLIQLYWDIGKEICERQKRYGWGKAVVEDLALELREAFSGRTGFSARNLWRMRNFFVTFEECENVPPVVAEINWTKIYLILEKCKDRQEREFYLKMTRKYGWSKDVLIHNILIKTFEKFLLNQTNFESQLPEEYKQQAGLAVKDEYMFDFMELAPEHSERELEQTLIHHIQKFLSEMGGMFALDLELLLKCDEVWVFGDATEGMEQEIRFAVEHGIHIYFKKGALKNETSSGCD